MAIMLNARSKVYENIFSQPPNPLIPLLSLR